MQFQEHLPQDGWNIEGGLDGRLKINGETHTEAVCLIEGRCLPANAARPQDLTADSFSDGLSKYPHPELILIGMGKTQRRAGRARHRHRIHEHRRRLPDITDAAKRRPPRLGMAVALKTQKRPSENTAPAAFRRPAIMP